MRGIFLNGQINGTMILLNSITKLEYRADRRQSIEEFLRAAAAANP